MTRCTYRSCRGSMFREPNEQTLLDHRPTIEKCGSCGRESGIETPTLLPTAPCREAGCLKPAAALDTLCFNHRAVATRRERVAG